MIRVVHIGMTGRVEVFRRHWFWILIGSPSTAAAIVLAVVIIFRNRLDAIPTTLAGWAEGLARLAERLTFDQWVQIAGVTLAVLGPVVLLKLRELRRRIEIDFPALEVRFRGFIRWDPWWRPRLGSFALPFGSINHVERHAWWQAGSRTPWHERPLRVVAGEAVVDIPPGMTRMGELESRLKSIAALNPPPPGSMTNLGLERMVMTGVWVAWFAALVIVLIWIAQAGL